MHASLCPPPSPRSVRLPARSRLLRAALTLLGAGLLTSCVTTAPLAPVPEPLPEALAWQATEAHGAFLGVEGEENDSGSLDALFFAPGVRVRGVVANSPAEASGLKPGDVVLSIDGRQVDDPGALDALVAGHAAGDRVELSVQRADTVFAVPVTLEARGPTAVAAPGSASDAGGAAGDAGAPASADAVHPRFRLDPSRSRAGWATGQGGVVLVSAPKDSPVFEAGLELGDVVTAIDGRSVVSDRELIRLLQTHDPGAEVELTVAGPRGGDSRTVELELQEQPTKITGFGLPFLLEYEADVDGHKSRVGVLDLYLIQLFEYRREEGERTWVLLELFGWEVFHFSTGVGELSS
jgi:membrane-associated protease RseP (regulator of RpoE activity)